MSFVGCGKGDFVVEVRKKGEREREMEVVRGSCVDDGGGERDERVERVEDRRSTTVQAQPWGVTHVTGMPLYPSNPSYPNTPYT